LKICEDNTTDLRLESEPGLRDTRTVGPPVWRVGRNMRHPGGPVGWSSRGENVVSLRDEDRMRTTQLPTVGPGYFEELRKQGWPASSNAQRSSAQRPAPTDATVSATSQGPNPIPTLEARNLIVKPRDDILRTTSYPPPPLHEVGLERVTTPTGMGTMYHYIRRVSRESLVDPEV